jgi:hypothetical protein
VKSITTKCIEVGTVHLLRHVCQGVKNVSSPGRKMWAQASSENLPTSHGDMPVMTQSKVRSDWSMVASGIAGAGWRAARVVGRRCVCEWCSTTMVISREVRLDARRVKFDEADGMPTLMLGQ